MNSGQNVSNHEKHVLHVLLCFRNADVTATFTKKRKTFLNSFSGWELMEYFGPCA